jgi:hypothetical protein
VTEVVDVFEELLRVEDVVYREAFALFRSESAERERFSSSGRSEPQEELAVVMLRGVHQRLELRARASAVVVGDVLPRA